MTKMGFASRWIVSLLGEFYSSLESKLNQNLIIIIIIFLILLYCAALSAFPQLLITLGMSPTTQTRSRLIRKHCLYFCSSDGWFVSSGSAETPVAAAVEITVGDVRIFPGENVRLKCTIADQATWSFLWFKGSEQLPQYGENLFIWRAQFRDTGFYHCQGVRGATTSQKSPPLEITVDGKSHPFWSPHSMRVLNRNTHFVFA